MISCICVCMLQSYKKKMIFANMNDEEYILRCLEIAKFGQMYVSPNPMVGALLVDPLTDTVVAEGWHQRFGGAHAEVECFASADRQMADLSDAKRQARYAQLTLYVSLEPCSHYGKTPPCADLIIRKGVKRVVVGMQDPNPQVAGRGIARLRDAGIEVTVGVAEQACRELNKRFLCLHEKHRPYVILKWAQTSDGFIDQKRDSGSPLVISTPLTKRLVHKMRAENMAILVGTRTALLDNPSLLTTRWPGKNPVRLLLDRHDVVPRSSKIFSEDAETIVYHDNTDWLFILDDLAHRGIHSVLVEGGSTVLQHILETGIWDEMHIEVSPVLIGDGVPAPRINLPEKYDEIDGNKLFTVLHDKKIAK